MTFAAIMFLAAAAALLLMARTMRKPTGESREERIRNDFDFHETDPKIIELGRRLTREKPACKPNGPRPISLVAVSLSQGSAFCLTTASHTMRGPLRPLVGSL